MAPPGIELGLSDPEPSRAGLFGGHHVRKWLPAKHRRPQARGAMPGLVRRNACKTLAKGISQGIARELCRLASLQAFRKRLQERTRRTVRRGLDSSVQFGVGRGVWT